MWPRRERAAHASCEQAEQAAHAEREPRELDVTRERQGQAAERREPHSESRATETACDEMSRYLRATSPATARLAGTPPCRASSTGFSDSAQITPRGRVCATASVIRRTRRSGSPSDALTQAAEHALPAQALEAQ